MTAIRGTNTIIAICHISKHPELQTTGQQTEKPQD
jgi:hypothetical protein